MGCSFGEDERHFYTVLRQCRHGILKTSPDRHSIYFPPSSPNTVTESTGSGHSACRPLLLFRSYHQRGDGQVTVSSAFRRSGLGLIGHAPRERKAILAQSAWLPSKSFRADGSLHAVKQGLGTLLQQPRSVTCLLARSSIRTALTLLTFGIISKWISYTCLKGRGPAWSRGRVVAWSALYLACMSFALVLQILNRDGHQPRSFPCASRCIYASGSHSQLIRNWDT